MPTTEDHKRRIARAIYGDEGADQPIEWSDVDPRVAIEAMARYVTAEPGSPTGEHVLWRHVAQVVDEHLAREAAAKADGGAKKGGGGK